MLSERLQELVYIGAVLRTDGEHGPEYHLTKSGKELAAIVESFGRWGQRWLSRSAADEDNDVEPVLVDMQRRVRVDALPKDPIVVRFEIERSRRFMLLKKTEISICGKNLGFPELAIRSQLPPLVAWWRGDSSFFEARRMGLQISGPNALVRAFPDWFERYQLAGIQPAARRA
jgi:hypothetical protein